MGARTLVGRSWTRSVWYWPCTALLWTTFYACGSDSTHDSGSGPSTGGAAGQAQGGADSGGGQGGNTGGADAGGADAGAGQGGADASAGQGGADASAGQGGVGAYGGQGGAGASGGTGTGGGGGIAGGGGASGAAGAAGSAGSTGDVSGTRLKAEFWSGVDGAKHYPHTQMFDSQLGLECTFATASDMQLRCLPTVDPSATEGIVLFQDSACTQPYAWIKQPPPSGCPYTLPTLVHATSATSVCPYSTIITRIYPTIAVIANPAGYQLTASGCSRTNVSYSGMITVSLGPEISPSTYVSGTETHDP